VLATARTEAEALLADGPPVDIALRGWRVVAEVGRRAGRPEDALRAVDRALAVAPADRRPPWLLERARLLQPRGREQALATLGQIVREHPKSLEAADALLLRGQILEAAPTPSIAEAEAAYLRLAGEYPDDEDAGTALWRLGWLAWFRGAHQEAAHRWSRLSTIRGGQRLREAGSYWIGRAHEMRGDAEAATRQFTSIVASVPRSYYGVLAAARVGRSAPPPARDAAGAGPALPADPLEPVRGDERYVKAEALRAIGLASFADGELEDLGRRAAGDPARLYAVSAAHVEGARYHLALRILRREFLSMARGGNAALPRAFWEMFYPLGWKSELTGAAGRAALDPFFVAAVVREESSYDPLARSRVGARGLMQLMPETARPMARSRGLAFQDGGLLDEPGANIELGSAFIAGLVKEFRDPRLAVASYNAGPRRVREWWAARRSDDVEEWVEQIPYNETRNFVKRVMLAWEEYRRLYAQP
jgi:soluble lytic murein transglycosylase